MKKQSSIGRIVFVVALVAIFMGVYWFFTKIFNKDD